MTEQALNRLYILALADKKGREAVAELMEPELLAGFQWMPTLIAAGRILSFAIMLALTVLSFIFVHGKLLYVPELQKF
jgi:uncharacterized membrane protein YhfC